MGRFCQKNMDGILNVKDFGAVGNGMGDDRPAIQKAINRLRQPDYDSPSTPASPRASGLYFPTGTYRIEGPIEVNFYGAETPKGPVVRKRLTSFRIFGPGGRGSQTGGNPDGATNVIIEQAFKDEPVFVFKVADTHSWVIDSIGFRWEQPPTVPTTPPTPLPPGKLGAVGILFSGEGGAKGEQYYNGRISDCSFRDGWRGIAIDQNYDGGVALWNTEMDSLLFENMIGAAISTANGPTRGIGMPVNSIRNTFVNNYQSTNVEPQLILVQQGGMVIQNLTMEASKTTVMSCVDSKIVMQSLSVEHAALGGEVSPKLFYLGGGHYSIDGIGIDGWIDSMGSVGALFFLGGSAPGPGSAGSASTLVLSGVRVLPHDPSVEDLEDGGFTPLNGNTFLLYGADTTHYHLLDPPFMPIYASGKRAEWNGGGTYSELLLWAEVYTSPNMSQVVQAPEFKGNVNLDFPSIAPGTVRALAVQAPGAQRGDLVRLGPPHDLPPGLMATGVVTQYGVVQVRLFNATSQAVNPPNRTWMVAAGGGAERGRCDLGDPVG